MAKSRNVAPCCCTGYLSIQPAPWMVVIGGGFVGAMAPMNDGYILPYVADQADANKCVYLCSSVAPFTIVSSYITGIASGSPFRRTHVTMLYTGGFCVFRTEIPPSPVEHCRGIRGTTPFILLGSPPFGSAIGSIMYTGLFRTLAAARAYAPHAGEGCVPVF